MRKRCTWTTKDTCKMYKYQINEYNEIRITMFEKVFRTFNGQNKFNDAFHFWNNIKAVNS